MLIKKKKTIKYVSPLVARISSMCLMKSSKTVWPGEETAGNYPENTKCVFVQLILLMSVLFHFW